MTEMKFVLDVSTSSTSTFTSLQDTMITNNIDSDNNGGGDHAAAVNVNVNVNVKFRYSVPMPRNKLGRYIPNGGRKSELKKMKTKTKTNMK